MFYTLSYALNRKWDVLSGVAEIAWDVLSGAAKMAWDVLSGVTKTAWDVLSGVANLCGMFCPGCQKNGMGCFVAGCFVLHSYRYMLFTRILQINWIKIWQKLLSEKYQAHG